MISQHAQQRMQQRGFDVHHIDLIVQFGLEKHIRGAYVYTCTKKMSRLLKDEGVAAQDIEKCQSSYVVVAAGIVVTVAHIH
jgi:hypothetical protein